MKECYNWKFDWAEYARAGLTKETFIVINVKLCTLNLGESMTIATQIIFFVYNVKYLHIDLGQIKAYLVGNILGENVVMHRIFF